MARKRASRRQFLATVLGASAAGLSGCNSGGNETATDSGQTETATETTATATPEPTPTETAEPTDTPTDTPEATATAVPSLSSWPRFMRNDHNWGHHDDATGPHGDVSVDWKTEFPQSQVNATPVLADGTLYVGAGGAGDDDGSFHALDPLTGEPKWSKSLDAPVTSAGAVTSDFVYVGTSDGILYAFEPGDGSEFWDWNLTSTEDFTAPTVVDGKIYIGSTGSRVYKFDGFDSTLEWNKDAFGAITSAPAYGDGTIYAPSRDNDVYAITQSGNLKWQQSFGASANGVVYRRRRLYVASEDNRITQLNTQGSVDWESSLGAAPASPPAVTEDRVFTGTRDNTLFALDISDGIEEWRFTEPEDSVTAPPVVADGTVYVGCQDGNVYAVDAESGDLEWSFETGGNIERAAPVVAGGRVYIGSQDGTLYALSE